MEERMNSVQEENPSRHICNMQIQCILHMCNRKMPIGAGTDEAKRKLPDLVTR